MKFSTAALVAAIATSASTAFVPSARFARPSRMMTPSTGLFSTSEKAKETYEFTVRALLVMMKMMRMYHI